MYVEALDEELSGRTTRGQMLGLVLCTARDEYQAVGDCLFILAGILHRAIEAIW